MPAIAFGSTSFIRRIQQSIQLSSDDLGQTGEEFEKSFAFHGGFPESPSAEAMSMGDGDSETEYLAFEGFVNQVRAESLLVERAEPGIVIADQKTDRPSSLSKSSQRAKTETAHRIDLRLSRCEPKIAKIAGDQQGVVAMQVLDKTRQSLAPIGSIPSKMDVAEEKKGQGNRRSKDLGNQN